MSEKYEGLSERVFACKKCRREVLLYVGDIKTKAEVLALSKRFLCTTCTVKESLEHD